MLKRIVRIGLLGAGLAGCVYKYGGSGSASDQGPSPARTPAQELASFQIEPGLKVQLVASEPMVQDPVVITFDEDGRLWVVEMRGFMTSIDASDEKERNGRVSVLEDTNGDGKMDKSTIYLDSLILPRALALVPGGALVAENEALWLTQDLNGDLKADTKVLIDKDYAGSGLPEHAGNGLWRGMDNWYYNVKSRLRYRLVNDRWERDSTEFRGQWGMSHDDQGRLFYNYNWSQLHADLVPPNYLMRNKHHTPTTGIDHGLTVDRRIYPIRPNPAINRGYIPGILDDEGRLMEFTAACSPLYYRGKALPGEYYGNAFVCEPSGNLIKRNVVEQKGVLLTAHDPHPGREFMASTDERFRPVHLTSGPDGALYVADMYRGLVQHGAYITPYLKEQTLSRKLLMPVHRGRIWRVVPENWKPSKPAKLSAASSADLVGYLSHADGWYRDAAQRLLVGRRDLSVRAALTTLARRGPEPLGQFHALWTLDGLGLSTPDLLLELTAAGQPLVSAAALRILEPMAKTDVTVRRKLSIILNEQWEKAPQDLVLQMALSAEVLEPAAALPVLAGIADRYGETALLRDAVLSSLQDRELALMKYLWDAPRWQTHEPAKEIFLEMLSTAVVRKRDPAELTALLRLLENETTRLGWQEMAVLNGMAIQAASGKGKPVVLTAAPALFSRTAEVGAARLAALGSLFTWPGHGTSQQVAVQANPLSEADQKVFALGRQHYLTTCAGCHGTDGAGLNRFAPPLIGSDWVTGDDKRLALIVLHGMEGAVEVAGKTYDAPEILPVMPAHMSMDDATITAILTYIRNEWGHSAGAVSRRTVAQTRNTSQGRVMPWKAAELNDYIQKTKDTR
jgi:mono/diheme cytochrome c family protein/glucose/arabinose dehydrogenase